MWSKNLARLQYFDPSIFLGSAKADERVCGFTLALALYANDAKVLLGLTIGMTNQEPKFTQINEELGEYSGQKNYLHRLIYAHLHELHYIFIQHHPSVSELPLFKTTIKNMSSGSRRSWDQLVKMSLDKSDPMHSWLKNVRDGLGFHYVRHSQLINGYRKWNESRTPGGVAATQEGAYISAGKSVMTTRYYFADAAADSWMGEEMKTFPNESKSLVDLMERNVIAISGFINSFIPTRGGELLASKYPPTK